jgi:hypothetical protein
MAQKAQIGNSLVHIGTVPWLFRLILFFYTILDYQGEVLQFTKHINLTICLVRFSCCMSQTLMSEIGHVTTGLTLSMLSVFYPLSEYKVTTSLTPQSRVIYPCRAFDGTRICDHQPQETDRLGAWSGRYRNCRVSCGTSPHVLKLTCTLTSVMIV